MVMQLKMLQKNFKMINKCLKASLKQIGLALKFLNLKFRK